jgi:hypothetical protein
VPPAPDQAARRHTRSPAGGATCDSERWRLQAVVDRIDTKIADLQRARRHALDILQDCRTGQCRLNFQPAHPTDPQR